MYDFFSNIFNTSGFPARWHCGSGWTPFHGWLHIISDMMVFGAYMAIPFVILNFLRLRRDIPFRPLFGLFAAFIFFCGTTHLMEAIIFWWPAYRLAGLIKLGTGIVSWAAVYALYRTLPIAIALRTPTELQAEVTKQTESYNNELLRRRDVELKLNIANRRKDEFMAMLGHELRNPLSPLRAGITLLQEGLPAEGQTEMLSIMDRQVDHMIKIVDDLLDISRLMRGRIELKKETIEINDLLGQAIATVQPLLNTHLHTLEIALLEKPVWVNGDRVRLTQVVVNLLNNAIKYTPDGGQIKLSMKRHEGKLCIHVKDNGMGMDADLVANVFDPFVQGGRTIDRSQGGLGIGLSIVRTLVELHGGHVSCTSAGANQGSEFVVELPEHVMNYTPQFTSKAKKGRRLKILVIEDNRDTAHVMQRMLQRIWGHETQVAYDGEQGVKMAMEYQPDLVLCDIGLPAMDGYEVAKQLQDKGHADNMLLIAHTGYGQEDDRRKALEAGFADHVTKPASVQDLEALFAHPRLNTTGQPI